MKLSASVIAATLAIAPSLPSTLAWGAFGHQVIAYLASQFVTQETQTFCQNILSDTSADYLATVSTWADSFRVTSAGRFSAPFHFIDAHDNPPTSCGVDFNRDCKAAGCVVSALTNYTARVQDNSLSTEDTFEALKFLVHFVGDIHQPLHDENLQRGGNGIKVTFDGTATNLHHIWDDNIPEKWAGGKTMAEAATTASGLAKAIKSGAYQSQAASWINGISISNAQKTTLGWAEDANSFVCSTVLKDDLTVVEGTDLGGKYFETASPIVQEQLAKAGYRLAAWLNLIATGKASL